MKKYLINLSVVLLVACSSPATEEQGFQVYDLDQEFEEIELSLNDVMQEPELVFLEATEESLLDQFSYVIGEKYIVVLERDRILLFDRDGNYLRKLASSGRGPGEFQGFYSYIFDPKEEYFYLTDYNRQSSILAYKLSDGSYKEIKTPGRTYSIIFVDDNTLLGTGSSNGPFRYFLIDIPSEELTTKDQEVTENSTSGTVGSLFRDGSQIYLYQNDTLYSYADFEITPKSTFSIKDKMNTSTLSSGNTFSVRIVTSDFTIVNKSYLEINQSGGNISINSSNNQMICIDQNTNELFALGPLEHEKSAELSSSYLARSIFNGDLISLKYDVAVWLDIIESKDAKSLPKNLITASEGLDYEDNPVLVIGKVKSLK